MTEKTAFQGLKCFADVMTTTNRGFSWNHLYQIWAISVKVFVSLDLVSVIIDGGCDSHLVWDKVAY